MTEPNPAQEPQPVEIRVTCSNHPEARTITNAVLAGRHAAVAHSWEVRSQYWWKETLIIDNEIVVGFKTTVDKFEVICDIIREHHSYDLPAITMTRIDATGPGYGDWLTENVTPTQ